MTWIVLPLIYTTMPNYLTFYSESGEAIASVLLSKEFYREYNGLDSKGPNFLSELYRESSEGRINIASVRRFVDRLNEHVTRWTTLEQLDSVFPEAELLTITVRVDIASADRLGPFARDEWIRAVKDCAVAHAAKHRDFPERLAALERLNGRLQAEGSQYTIHWALRKFVTTCHGYIHSGADIVWAIRNILSDTTPAYAKIG